MGAFGRRVGRLVGACALVVSGLAMSPVQAAAAPLPYTSVSSARLLDTRPTGNTIDGQFARAGLRPQNGTLALTVTGRAGIPAGASAVVLNVTATEAAGSGFVTVYPCDSPRPEASNLNFVAGQTIPNEVITRLDGNGQICLFNLAATHLIVDISGYFPTTDSLVPLPAPVRLLDTRPTGNTIDGQFARTGLPPQNGNLAVTVTGRAGIPTGVSAVVLNVTATEAQGSGFVTVYPCDSPRPEASNLNYVAGDTIPNAVIARLDTYGQICLFDLAPTHLIVDISGYFPTADSLVPLPAPVRLLDTRPTGNTIDGLSARTGLRPTHGTVTLSVTGRAGIPANASAVVLNVTATEARGSGYATVFRPNLGFPEASNLNYVADQTIPNAAIARIAGGNVCIFNLAPTHLIVDVVGYLVGEPTLGGVGACPADKDPPFPPPPPPPPPGLPGTAPGNHVVGQSIQPGNYLGHAQPGCSWQRLSSLGGTPAEIIAAEDRTFPGPVIVEVKPTDAGFNFSPACGPLFPFSLFFQVVPGYMTPAIYPGTSTLSFIPTGSPSLVSGTYYARAGSGCSWKRLSGFGATPAETIAEDLLTQPATITVTVAPTDVGFFANAACGIWTAI